MLVHVVKETDKGIIIRGAKYETAAAYANQAFVKPTIANWGDAKLSDYALGCIVRHGCAGHEAHLPHRLRRQVARRDYPLSNKFDEVDTLHDLRRRADPLGERAVLPAHRAAAYHPLSACTAIQRVPLRPAHRSTIADMLIGAALCTMLARPGSTSSRRCRRSWPSSPATAKTINAHLTAVDGGGREEPGRPADAQPVAALYRPRPCLLNKLPAMMHMARELCGGQICVTPDAATCSPSPKRQVAEQVLLGQRELAIRGSPPAARLGPRPDEFGLCRPPRDLRALRPGPALRAV
jgi:4-hydroxyphenylacetate 3-monooxygenase